MMGATNSSMTDMSKYWIREYNFLAFTTNRNYNYKEFFLEG